MKPVIRFFCSIFLTILLFLPSSFPVDACANGRVTDTVTGWTFKQPSLWLHSGTKNLTYYYSDSNGSDYLSYFQSGISLWGSNINITRSSDPYASGMDIIVRVDWNINEKATNANATTDYRLSGTPSMHATEWVITFHPCYMEDLTRYQNNIIAAHEIGHVFGLGEIWDSSTKVMYGLTPNSNTKVTTYDTRGIKLMTHDHTCLSSASSNSYAWVDGGVHKKRCKTCASFVYEAHTNGASCTLCS